VAICRGTSRAACTHGQGRRPRSSRVDGPFPVAAGAAVAALYEDIHERPAQSEVRKRNILLPGCGTTILAFVTAVNELQSSAIPLLASPQGVAASSIKYCEATREAPAR